MLSVNPQLQQQDNLAYPIQINLINPVSQSYHYPSTRLYLLRHDSELNNENKQHSLNALLEVYNPETWLKNI